MSKGCDAMTTVPDAKSAAKTGKTKTAGNGANPAAATGADGHAAAESPKPRRTRNSRATAATQDGAPTAAEPTRDAAAATDETPKPRRTRKPSAAAQAAAEPTTDETPAPAAEPAPAPETSAEPTTGETPAPADNAGERRAAPAVLLRPDFDGLANRSEFTPEEHEELDAMGVPELRSGRRLLFRAWKRTDLSPFDNAIYLRADHRNTTVREEINGTMRDVQRSVPVYKVATYIDGFRLVASRQGTYEGQTEPLWCGRNGQWTDVWLGDGNPHAARIGVLHRGFRAPVWGVARFASFYPNPKALAASMPDHMIAKCAEALALRKAYPDKFAGLYIAEELIQSGGVAPDPHAAADEAAAQIFDMTDAAIQAYEAARLVAEDPEAVRQIWRGARYNVRGNLIHTFIPEARATLGKALQALVPPATPGTGAPATDHQDAGHQDTPSAPAPPAGSAPGPDPAADVPPTSDTPRPDLAGPGQHGAPADEPGDNERRDDQWPDEPEDDAAEPESMDEPWHVPGNADTRPAPSPDPEPSGPCPACGGEINPREVSYFVDNERVCRACGQTAIALEAAAGQTF
jgi:hypothetical protein